MLFMFRIESTSKTITVGEQNFQKSSKACVLIGSYAERLCRAQRLHASQRGGGGLAFVSGFSGDEFGTVRSGGETKISVEASDRISGPGVGDE
jgi:hypothetical protein